MLGSILGNFGGNSPLQAIFFCAHFHSCKAILKGKCGAPYITSCFTACIMSYYVGSMLPSTYHCSEKPD